jgi:amino acid transporter
MPPYSILSTHIVLLTFVNCYSVEWATKVQDIFTYAKLLALFIIIAVGVYLLSQGLFDIQNVCVFCFIIFTFFSPRRRLFLLYCSRLSIYLSNNKYISILIFALLFVFFLFISFIGNVQYFTFDGTITETTSIALSFYSGLFAYNGWNYLNFIIEELKDPVKNLPKAIAVSLILVTLVYLFTNIGKFSCFNVSIAFHNLRAH